MKLIVNSPQTGRIRSDPLNVCAWIGYNEALAVSGDGGILRWNTSDMEAEELGRLPEKVQPICVKAQVAGGGRRGTAGHLDVITVGCSDGNVYMLSRSGRAEKTIESHKGGVLTLCWVGDGAAYATGGEDGQVKIWSRAGMYRNTLVQSTNPVYSLAWSPDNDSILYADGNMLTIKPRQAGSKHTQWKAHDGIVLCVDWSPTNRTIVSGSEDRTYKVWDSFGQPLFSSRAAFHQYPILTVAWAPDGGTFAIGSYDTIRLCDNAGWSAAMEKCPSGGIYSIDWSRDSTGFLCGTGGCEIMTTKVIEKKSTWRHQEATMQTERSIQVCDTRHAISDTVELGANIVRVSVGWEHLVVVTAAPSLVIHSSKNYMSPAMVDLKDVTVTMIKQTERHFLMAGSAGIQIHGYDGRVLATLRCQGMQCDLLTEDMVTVSSNTVAVRDRKNEQVVFLFEALSGKPIGNGEPYKHPTEIACILLDQCGPPNQRNLAILDRNHDVYLLPVRQLQGKVPPLKIASMTSQIMWDDSANVLATVEDGAVRFYCHPAAGFTDQSLLSQTKIEPLNEVARKSTMVTFSGKRAILRRPDGAVVIASMDPYASFLHAYALAGKWEDCQRLCRFVDTNHLWACLAALSLQAKEIGTAVEAYAALGNAAKVTYLDKIKDIPSQEGRNGEIALLCHQQQQAEAIFLQAGLVYRAIDMHIRLCNFEKALELATKHKTHVDTVVAYRKKYLKGFDREETNKKFIQYAQGMEIDWDKIKAKVALEREKEEKRRQ